MEFRSVNKLIEKSIKTNWEKDALSNYQGVTLKYKDVAQRIKFLHIAFEKCGLKKGDKIITAGGIYGTVKEVKDTTLLIEVDSNVTLRIDKNMVVADNSQLQK